MLQEMREALSPNGPVVVGAMQNYPLMRVVLFLQASMVPTAVWREYIRRAHIDGDKLRGVLRELIFVQDRREQSHLAYPLWACVGEISSHARAVTQTGYDGIGRNIVERIDHIDEVAQRVLQLMLITETRIAENTPQFVSARERSLLNRPFIAVGHNENHGFATPFGNHCSKRIDSIAALLPCALIAVDAVDKIKDRQGFYTLFIRVRHIDIHAAEDVLVVAIPSGMDNIRRFACRGAVRHV